MCQEPPVHPGGHELAGVDQENVPLLFHVGLRQRQVLRHRAFHRFMRADGLIGLPRRENELAIGNRVPE